MAAADPPQNDLCLVIRGQGSQEHRVEIRGERMDIGRLDTNDVCLPRGSVAKHHAQLIRRAGRFRITDLRTSQGTFVNGKRARYTLPVAAGDEIAVGTFRLTIERRRAPRPPLYQEDPVARAELRRRLDSGDWRGVVSLLEEQSETQQHLGAGADWSHIEEGYRSALERASRETPPPELEARLWGRLCIIYRDAMGDKREAHEALKVARRLDPDRWSHVTLRPEAPSAPRAVDPAHDPGADLVREPTNAGEDTEVMECPPAGDDPG